GGVGRSDGNTTRNRPPEIRALRGRARPGVRPVGAHMRRAGALSPGIGDHLPHAGRKRRSVRLFSTTLRLDHAIAALASTGESRTRKNGYSAPAATGMPITL